MQTWITIIITWLTTPVRDIVPRVNFTESNLNYQFSLFGK